MHCNSPVHGGGASARQPDVRILFPCASSKIGQSLIETCVVVGFIGLAFMSAFQVSQVLAAREVLHHAAARGARAKAVGFNRWMVKKAMRVAAIPNAGKMITPDYEDTDNSLEAAMQQKPGDFWDWALQATPQSARFRLEEARIPEYLGAYNTEYARNVLDYEDWDTVHTPEPEVDLFMIHSRTSQDLPLWVPLRRAFYGKDSARLSGDSYVENHYSVYMDDMGW